MEPTNDASVQPEVEQGSESQGGLHEHLLSSVPEHLRDEVAPLLSEWDKGVQRKFTEAAEYRKQWEPYEQLGVNKLQPQELQELLAFREIAQDPSAFQEWYKEVGQMMGLTPEEALQEYTDQKTDQPQPDPELEQIKAQFADFESWRSNQEQERLIDEMASHIRTELDDLKKDDPHLNQEDEEIICTLALKYPGEDAVRKGYDDFKAIMTRAEKGLFERKAATPDPSVQGGRPNTGTEPVTDMKEASRLARERLTRSNAT